MCIITGYVYVVILPIIVIIITAKINVVRQLTDTQIAKTISLVVIAIENMHVISCPLQQHT